MVVGVRPRSGGSSPNGLTTGRAVAVLAVVVGCLAVLWPKIFYPMLMVALRGTDGTEPDYPTPMAPGGSMVARLQQSGKRVPSPHARMAAPGPQGTSKGAAQGSTFNIIMPIYTLGIIILFVYMIFKIMSRGDKEQVDLDRLAYNERSQLGQQAMAARRGGHAANRDGPESAKGQNNNFEPPKRNRKDPRNAFENNTKMVLKMYGKDKMLDALNVVVNEMHEYKKQAIELAKQLEEKQQQKTVAANNGDVDDEIDYRERPAAANMDDDIGASDKDDARVDDAEENSDVASDDENEDEDEVHVEQGEEDVPSEAPSEQDSDESDKDIDNHPGEDETYEDDDGDGDLDDDVPQAIDDAEVTEEVHADADDDGVEELPRVRQPQYAKRTIRNVDVDDDDDDDNACCDDDEGIEAVESGEEQEEQIGREDLDPRSVADEDDVYNVNREDEAETSACSDKRHHVAGEEDDNDAEIEGLFCETSSDKNLTKNKKAMVNKSVYARHPECLCETPPPHDDYEEEPADEGQGEAPHRDEAASSRPHLGSPPAANTIDDICRNQEGLQFLDHATEIEPGAKLQCYDDVIYGQCVTERTPEENGNDGSPAGSHNGLQILQDLITKDRGGDFDEIGQEPAPSDYQQWKSITPEDLFKTASAVVEKTDERNANRERNSRRNYRSDDRVNGNYHSNTSAGPMKSRLPPQNFYYEDSAPPGGFEENGKLRRRTRRARRAD